MKVDYYENKIETQIRIADGREQEIERLKGLIEKVHTDAYGISPIKWQQFKKTNNL